MEFREEEAIAFGVDEAIFINYLRFWINKNRANDKHFYNDKYWTYNSAPALCEIFKFWSEKQIRRIIDSLVELNIIEKGNFNRLPFDKTAWYSFVDQDMLKNDYVITRKRIAAKSKTKKFVKPTFEEVHKYCIERKNSVDAQKFVDYYESKGWLVGKTPMKDWKAAVRTWEQNSYGKGYSNKSKETTPVYELVNAPLTREDIEATFEANGWEKW